MKKQEKESYEERTSSLKLSLGIENCSLHSVGKAISGIGGGKDRSFFFCLGFWIGSQGVSTTISWQEEFTSCLMFKET